MTRLRLCVLLLLGSLTSGAAVHAAENPIVAFPQETGMLVRLKAPQKTLKTVGELATKVDEQAGAQVQAMTPLVGVLISNPQLKGVDQNSDWWLGIFPVENADPGVVFCIPASDADAMKDAITGDFEFLTYDKWVLYTEHEDTAKKLKAHLEQTGKNIGAMVSQEANAVWDEGHLSILVNTPQIVKVYDAAIDEGVKQFNEFWDQFPAMAPPQQAGVNMEAIADMYKSGFAMLIQGLKDAEVCTAGVMISDQGVQVREHVDFAGDSKTAKFLAQHKPTALATLDKLPGDHLIYGAADLDFGQFVQWSMKMSLSMMAKGDTVKEKEMKTLIEGYGDVKFETIAMAFGLGTLKDGALRMASLMDAENPEKVRELSIKSSKLMSDLDYGNMKMKMTFEPEAETYGDIKADLAKVQYEMDQQNDPLQIQSKINDALYGPDGMITRTFYLKKQMAQTIGGGKLAAKNLLAAIDGTGGVSSQTAYSNTRKQLLKEANLLGMANLPGLIAGIMEVAIDAGAPLPIGQEELKAIRGEASFLGFSLAFDKSAMSAKTVLPVEQMQGVAKFARFVWEAKQREGL